MHRSLPVLAAIAVLLAACGGPASSDSSSGTGTLTAVIGYGNNQSWDPTQTASAFSMAAFTNVYEPLVAGDPITREPEAALAAVPDEVDGTTITFQLREGAKWSDGKPVTADDVVFTYDRILDPQENVQLRAFFSGWLDEVVAKDDSTVEFRLKRPFRYALNRVETAMIVPQHVFDGKWEEAAAGKTLGSGPYEISEQAALDHTTFVKNDQYNGDHPAQYDSMVWKSIVDAAPRVAAVSGARPQAQIADNIPPANIDQLRKDGRQVEAVQGQNNVFLMFNTQKKPFDDKRVRQALHYAIDADKVVSVALKGQGVAATSYLNPELEAYQKASTDYAYDPAKAQQLLKEAGVSNLSITLGSTNTSLVADTINVIKEGWDAVGVKTTLNAQDTKALFSKLDGGEDYQVVAASGNPQQFGNDPDLIERFYYSPASLWSSTYARFQGPDADALYDQMDKAAYAEDDATAKSENKKVLDTIADEAVLYPVVFTRLVTAWVPDRLGDVQAQGYPGINVLRAQRIDAP
ncbi:ABC transporter substrate-binding protein [Kineosporia sp. NBRC 101731]|uniref:ABC transporter substrate-binding protein n=1 Tax=Kineosporia sp. NBRC 101731 TaxID=3032199 RepID=UPI0024A59E19|nr:ABC transporter substrate-binding protein [Kineosporia sp. NBRC 101731]GLY31331.1 ABC transporter substrate-binding protein [Kineosporia sp. NBRC 101731]